MPDWTQQDADPDTIKAWMREHRGKHPTASDLATAALNHFARPYHLDVLYRWAIAIVLE